MPRAWVVLGLPTLSLTLIGSIAGNGEETMIAFVEADFDDIKLTLCKHGAFLSGEVTWKIAGDESAETEPLLGNLCKLTCVLKDSEQGDLLKAA